MPTIEKETKMSEITLKVKFIGFTKNKVRFHAEDEAGHYSIGIYIAKTLPVVELPDVIKLELDTSQMAK